MKLLVSILSILTFLLVVTGAASAAPQRTTLYDFGGGWPGPLTLARDGSLYGVLESGGSQGRGEVYRLSPDTTGWRKDVLHEFSNDGNGIGPSGALSILDDGTVLGTLFALTPSAGGAWNKQLLRVFNGRDPARAGESPNGGLIPDGQGSFLGTTFRGGSWDGGTLYRVTPPVSGTGWSVQTVLDFIWSNGALPSASMVSNGKGAFYTVLAGTKDIYMLSPPSAGQSSWTQNLLHNYPAELWEFRWPLVVDRNGAIYGTTANKIFRLIPPTAKQTKWRSVILMTFSKKNRMPNGFGLSGVTVDANGVLYGVTSAGGTSAACGKAGCGTLFKLTPPAPGQTKYSFTVIDPQAGGINGLSADRDGVLYGTTGSSVFVVTGSGFQP
jgi:uncharacterized repeat protein (TIGR03803 family)